MATVQAKPKRVRAKAGLGEHITEEERSLFLSAQQGDQEALSVLLQRHFGLVRYCVESLHFMLPGMDESDLCQEGAIALMRAILRYRPDQGVRFSTYAVTAIRRQFANLYRRTLSAHRSHHETVSLDAPLHGQNGSRPRTLADELHSATNNPDEQLDLEIALSCLDPDEQRVALLLTYGHTQSEVAEELGLSPASVRKIIRKIRKKLPRLPRA